MIVFLMSSANVIEQRVIDGLLQLLQAGQDVTLNMKGALKKVIFVNLVLERHHGIVQAYLCVVAILRMSCAYGVHND
jgi:hypothetical protein